MSFLNFKEEIVYFTSFNHQTMSDPEFECISPDDQSESKTVMDNKVETQEPIKENKFENQIEDEMEDEIEGESNIKDNVFENNEEDKDEEEIVEDIIHRNIFLMTSENSYAPYTAHCLLLGKATVLVLLSQVL